MKNMFYLVWIVLPFSSLAAFPVDPCQPLTGKPLPSYQFTIEIEPYTPTPGIVPNIIPITDGDGGATLPIPSIRRITIIREDGKSVQVLMADTWFYIENAIAVQYNADNHGLYSIGLNFNDALGPIIDQNQPEYYWEFDLDTTSRHQFNSLFDPFFEGAFLLNPLEFYTSVYCYLSSTTIVADPCDLAVLETLEAITRLIVTGGNRDVYTYLMAVESTLEAREIACQ